ncbi:hypothetical protein DFH28DRAFT_1196851 [Melampsora americana]|nr:hypothetical protein DFH28DRAFT_1196851 [Melampsora americana]
MSSASSSRIATSVDYESVDECIVVKFTNECGCPPCKAIAPVYEALASEFKTDKNLQTGHPSTCQKVTEPDRARLWFDSGHRNSGIISGTTEGRGRLPPGVSKNLLWWFARRDL